MTDNEYIDKIREGDSRALSDVYSSNKREFLLFAQKHFKLDKDTAIDFYHDAILTLSQNIRSGKLISLKCKLKTYIFSIARNSICNDFRKRNKLSTEIEVSSLSSLEDVSYIENENETSIKIKIVSDLISQMTEICKKIITMFYIEEKKYEEIILIMKGYKTIDVLKTQKYRCLKQMQGKLKVLYGLNGLS